MLLLIGLLCFCVVMQILGMPISFWDLQDSSDMMKSSLSIGFTIPAPLETFFVALGPAGFISVAACGYGILAPHDLFHPPTLFA